MRYARLSELVTTIEPRLEPGFVDDASLARIHAIAARIPARASDFFGFERTLGRDDSRADFALGVSEFGASWLVERGPWREIGALLSRVPERVATGHVRPWLEFDTGVRSDAAARPSAYVGIDPRADDAGEIVDFIRHLTDDVAHSPALERCVASFPTTIARLYVGAMFGREPAALRLSVDGFSYDDLLAFVEAIGWCGDTRVLESVLSRVTGLCRRFCAQLDLSSELQPPLGIELVLDPSEPGDASNASELRLLRSLVADGLCSQGEYDALAHWPSRTACRVPLIDRLIDEARPNPDLRVFHGSIVTALHHVKIGFAHDGAVRTKAYFGVFLEQS